ncbi:hypothetical protein Tco_0239128, partial [Tanacetum coccineum]
GAVDGLEREKKWERWQRREETRRKKSSTWKVRESGEWREEREIGALSKETGSGGFVRVALNTPRRNNLDV